MPELEAVRAAYDTVALDYAEQLRTSLAERPIDRVMLAAFVELVAAHGGGPIADLGCGPGRITGHLSELGATVFGVDLSPQMIAVARRDHPELRFEVGSMAELDLADGVLGGIVAWYSTIHFPPQRLPIVFAEFHRVLSPGGHVVLAFQVGDETMHLEQAYGHDISLDAYRRPPELVIELVERAGLTVLARVIREPAQNEKTPQAYVLAQKPGPTGSRTSAPSPR